jgi:hypothetical protein
VNQRTALLKMLAADYCGTGKAFTVTGVPLRFQGRGWVEEHGFADAQVREAIWTEHGAFCLSTPRMKTFVSPFGTVTISEIEAECKDAHRVLPPSCEPYFENWGSYGDIRSAMPPCDPTKRTCPP